MNPQLIPKNSSGIQNINKNSIIVTSNEDINNSLVNISQLSIDNSQNLIQNGNIPEKKTPRKAKRISFNGGSTNEEVKETVPVNNKKVSKFNGLRGKTEDKKEEKTSANETLDGNQTIQKANTKSKSKIVVFRPKIKQDDKHLLVIF